MSKTVMLNTILRFYHSPGDYVMPAKHSGIELVFYRKGTGTTIIDGILYEYGPNSLAVIQPDTTHDETTITSSDVLFCIFDAGEETVSGESAFYRDKGMVTADIYDLMCRIESEMKLKQIHYEERVNLLLRELLIVIRRMEDQRTDSRGIINYVKRLLSENPGHNVDFHIIAESVGYSYDRFRHLFREQTGVSPSQYLLNLRIAEAKKLLENESLPISRVGMLCGFQNVSNFVTMFHKKTRVTPMQYRKLVIENPERDVLSLIGEEDSQINR